MQTTSIDDLLRHAAEAGEVPGVVAMAATAQEVIYSGAFGKRWLPDGPPMTSDTIFWIASMTKAITSTAAMLLVEQGKLSLDDPIGKVLPELAAPQVLEGFSTAGEPKLRMAKRPITLRHLLTHTSGFGYDIGNLDLLHYRQTMGIPEIMSCQNAALNLPLVFDPGERWEYGIGIDWAGKAIERVSGKALQSYFDENLFRPLGMKDTGFKLTAERRMRLAEVHARQDHGSLAQMSFELPQEPEFQMGGGGLYGTAADYLAFEQMFLNDGRCGNTRVLLPETVRLMGQNHIGGSQVTMLKRSMPFSNDAEFFPGMVKKFGLAFMINTEPVPGGRNANSLAWAGLANTYYWIDPAKKVAGVILTQILPFFDSKVVDLFSRFEKAIYASL
jgi:CubicO group peptidase (beta-lactamase class C family)